MTKLKKVLSKIYYYTWRILLIIILCCLSVYSIANTVNYFVDRNKQVQTSYREIQNIINPSINPQGLVSYCPLTNYISYNSREDYSYDFISLYNNTDVIARYSIMGNVLTIKDIVPNNRILIDDLYYLEDLPSQRYLVVLQFRGNNFFNGHNVFNTYFEFESEEGNITCEDNIGSSILRYTADIDRSQDLYFLFDDNDSITFLQVEFYLFSVLDLENYFGDDDIASYSDYLSSLLVPFGFDYIQGQGNNYFYDSIYIQGMLEDKYHEGYNAGYDDGGLVGYNEGYVDGKHDGDSIGYERGYYDGSHDDTSEAFQNGYNAGLTAQFNKGGFLGLANLIFNAPYNILHEVFNFEFLGVNLWGLMSFAFTTALVFAVIKLFM